MTWSPQQDQALRAIRAWHTHRLSPVFYLAGYAGTGKTTLAKQIAQDTRGEVIFCAFTGKAALVLQRKGCEGARTIHSLLYRPVEMANGPPTFELNERSDGERASLIIVDECSMVDEALGRDLLALGTPILVLGDPAQLPPVKGVGYFTGSDPDFTLTEIHRQAADNPIIRMSMDIRGGRTLRPGRYGDSEVIARGGELDAERVMAADQMLVGRNATRMRNNARFRELRGTTSPMPIAGDKLVCLKNNKDNTVEAQNPSLFIGGWRPALAWSLGAIVLMSFVLPYFVWLALAFGGHLPPPPTLDPQATYILAGLLGITIAARSVDKATGTAAPSIGGTAKTVTTKRSAR